jgi:hypothetical protein
MQAEKGPQRKSTNKALKSRDGSLSPGRQDAAASGSSKKTSTKKDQMKVFEKNQEAYWKEIKKAEEASKKENDVKELQKRAIKYSNGSIYFGKLENQ